MPRRLTGIVILSVFCLVLFFIPARVYGQAQLLTKEQGKLFANQPAAAVDTEYLEKLMEYKRMQNNRQYRCIDIDLHSGNNSSKNEAGKPPIHLQDSISQVSLNRDNLLQLQAFDQGNTIRTTSNEFIEEIEPNDSIALANLIWPDTMVFGLNTPYYDLDFYKISLTQAVRISITGVAGDYGDYMAIALQDSSGNYVDWSYPYVSSDGTVAQMLDTYVTAGTYYIMVMGLPLEHDSSYYPLAGEYYGFIVSIDSNVGPFVIATDPQKWDENVPTDKVFAFTYNEAIRIVNPSSIYFSEWDTYNTLYTTSWVTGSTLYIKPDSNFSPYTKYMVIVDYGAIANLNGVYQDEDYFWSFTTGGGPEHVVAVNSVSLNKNTMVIEKGKTETLVASINPANATNKTVNWYSSNPTVATVDSNGLVTGIEAGTVTITVTTVDGNKTATCSVTVEEPVAVQSVSLNKSNTRLIKGETEILLATIFPANASNRQVGWISSNTSVATVDSGGLVTAIEPGQATISVVTADGAKIASCSVNVVLPLTVLIREQLNQNMGEYFTALAIAKKVLATIQNDKLEVSMDDAFAIEQVLQMLSVVDQSYQLQRMDIGGSSYTREDILENLPTREDDIKADILTLVNNPNISSYEEIKLGDLAGKYITLVFAEEEIRLEFCQQDECFIATAAFGSKLQPAVVLLRQFRDKALLTNSPGRAFVSFYYQNSPPVAHYIAGKETAKLVVRILLLPFIAIAYMVINPTTTLVLLLLLLSIILYRRRATLQP